MAYDIDLAERLQQVMLDIPGISEKKMFGGLAFMSDGHMFIGIAGDALKVVRPRRRLRSMD